MAEMYIDLGCFGRCKLVEHPADEEPQSSVILGYVELPDRPNTVYGAMWAKGKWTDSGRRPFKDPITRWFHVEKADGAPLFGR